MIVLRELGENDVQNLRNLLYRKFGKQNVIVRSFDQEEESASRSCERKGNEYLQPVE